MRLNRDKTGMIYDVNYIIDNTKETDLLGELLSQQQEPKSRRHSSQSTAEERSLGDLEREFKIQEKEWKSRIAVANWQVFVSCE